MFDPDDLQLPPIGLLRRYLLANNWISTPLRDGALTLFTRRRDEEGPEIVLGNVEPTDTAKRILQALQTLSDISGVPVLTLAREISMFDFDIVQARLPNSLVIRDSIPLRVAERFIGNVRRFFTSAAAAEISGAVHVSNAQTIGAEYADSCRFAHTFRGSFGFTIESLAGPSPKTLDGEPSPKPVERRIIERMATGLSHLQLAAAVRSTDPILEGIRDGFNLNMLEDFQTLLSGSSASRIKFDFTLTPAWPTTLDQKLSAEVSDELLPLIDSAASQLRPPNVPQAEVVVGKIVWLESREVPTDLLHDGGREIGIEGESAERGDLSVKVRLDPQNYLAALDAHRTGRLVRVKGEVRRTARGNSFAGNSSFEVL